MIHGVEASHSIHFYFLFLLFSDNGSSIDHFIESFNKFEQSQIHVFPYSSSLLLPIPILNLLQYLSPPFFLYYLIC